MPQTGRLHWTFLFIQSETSIHLGEEELLCCLLLCLLGSGEADLLLGDLAERLGERDGDLRSFEI